MQAGQPTDGGRFGGAYEKDTWYRRRRLPVCVEPVRVRDHAVPKNRHASRPLCLPTPHNLNASRLGEFVP